MNKDKNSNLPFKVFFQTHVADVRNNTKKKKSYLLEFIYDKPKVLIVSLLVLILGMSITYFLLKGDDGCYESVYVKNHQSSSIGFIYTDLCLSNKTFFVKGIVYSGGNNMTHNLNGSFEIIDDKILCGYKEDNTDKSLILDKVYLNGFGDCLKLNTGNHTVYFKKMP